MHLTRCPKYHYYDMDKYDECPQCRPDAGLRKPPAKLFAEPDSHSVVLPAAPAFSEKTVSESFAEAAEEQAAFSFFTENPADLREETHTVCLDDFAENPADLQEEPHTVSLSDSDVLFLPPPEKTPEHTVMMGSAGSENRLTVGWLVCVQGVHRGESFALIPGQNFIGRSSAMDIRLTGENSVSKEFHAGVVFDPVSGNFFLVPGESHGLTYLNRVLVFSPAVLKDYDRILFGSCCCIFRSLCNQNFDWNHESGT